MDTLSHISLSVSDLKISSKFYDSVLSCIGLNRVYSGPTASGWGPTDTEEKFAIKKRVNKVATPSAGFHLAFHAKTRDEVHTFYTAALESGGKDNGSPGPRPKYGSDYYAAFVIDPDGYELEVKLYSSK